MKKKRNIRIKKSVKIEKIRDDSFYAEIMKKDEEQFLYNPGLSGFIRDYIPGEFPGNFLTEEEKLTIRYTLVKLSNEFVAGNRLMGKYPVTQEEFEYYQQNPSAMSTLDPKMDAEKFYRR